MKKFNIIKKSRKKSKGIDEKIEYLNKECQKTGLQEVMMTTTDMYFATQDNPAVDAVIAEVPDSTGVLGSGFTPPIGRNGDPNDPSNFPDAYDNSWMFNSNDVDGVSGRPIIASLDDKIFQDYATAREIALPGSQNPYPSGGGGIAFGSPAFGTAVGYIHGGHFKQILVGGLIGGTELVPAGATGPPFYGMGTVYFPAYAHDVSMWKAMTSAYVPLRDKLARGEIGTIPVMAWKSWNSFHDQPWDDIPSTSKYIGDGLRYVLSGFNVFAAANNYEKTPAIPASTTILYKSNLGDPTFLPIDIEGISPQAFDYLKDKAGKGTDVASNVNYDLYNYLDKRYGIEASNWYENNPTLPHESNPFIPPPEAPYLPLASNPNDSRFSEPVSDIEIPGLGAKPGDELAFGGFGGGNNKPITKKSDFGPIKKSTAIKDANFSIMGMGLSPKAFEKKYGISPQDFLNLPESKTSDKKNLDESVMKRFSIIKKSRKKSKGIDEKIEYLNKECQKTGLQEVMTTTNMYTVVQTVPAAPAEFDDVPDVDPVNGITSDNWTQPLGNDDNGNPASEPPTTFPRIWDNPGYSDPTDGLLNKNNLTGDGTALPIYKTDDLTWQDPSEVPAGAVGGMQIEVGGMDPGIVGGYLDSNGWNTTTGTHIRLGSPNFKTHPHLFKPVKYWQPFSIYHPYIDSYWPGGDRTPKYGGIVKGSLNGPKYALFTAYMYVGGGRNTYQTSPNTHSYPIVLKTDNLGDPLFLPIDIGRFGLSPQGFYWLKDRATDLAKKYKSEDDMWDAMADFLDKHNDPAEDPFSRKGTGMDDRWIGPPVDKAGYELEGQTLSEKSKSRHFKRKVKNEDVIDNTKFNVIKKSRKKSKGIDEKIEYLNKECQKTGLNEIMTTTGIYQGSTSVPNQQFSDFEGIPHGGYGFALSGGDGNGAGGGTVGVIDNTVSNCSGHMGLTGVAISPPHPITGFRRCARTQTGFAGFFSPLRPGVIQTNSGVPSGGALWFFDPLYNFAGQQGRWLNFQWHPGANSWAFWDTNFLGFFFLNPNLDQYTLHGQNIGTEIKNKLAGMNFGSNGALGTPETTVLTQNDLGDPGFLPINIPDLSKQAFDYLKEKAQQAVEAVGNFAMMEPQDFFNAAVSGAFPPNPENNYAPDIAGSIASNEVRTYENEDIPDEHKEKLIQNMDWTDIGFNIPITSSPTNYSDDNFYVNDDGKVTPHTPGSKINFPPNTATHGDASGTKGKEQKFSDNPLGKAGEYHFELVVPPDGSEPYFNYEDHAYYNPNSADTGEVPTSITQALANISQAAGQQLPGYPEGIKGDVVKKVKIPLSDAVKINPDIINSPKFKEYFN